MPTHIAIKKPNVIKHKTMLAYLHIIKVLSKLVAEPNKLIKKL